MNEIIESAEYTKAVALHRKICANAQAAQESLWEVCRGLKEIHDFKLFKELGYESFKEYCEKKLDITDRQARNYISLANSFSEEERKSISAFGTTKLLLLAKLNEPQREEIQQTVNVEEVSVRELKAEIDKLKDEKSKFDEEKAGYKERQDKLLKKNVELVKERDKAQQEQEKLTAKINAEAARSAELEKQIQELESRPRDSYEDTTKIEELKKQLAEAEERHRADLRINSTEDIKGIFKAHMMAAVDALRNLTKFAEAHENSPEKALFIEKLENVDILINQTINRLKGV